MATNYYREDVRLLLTDSFSSEELSTLAFDIFHDLEPDLVDLDRTQKTKKIIDYTEKHGYINELLLYIKEKNSFQYKKYIIRQGDHALSEKDFDTAILEYRKADAQDKIKEAEMAKQRQTSDALEKIAIGYEREEKWPEAEKIYRQSVAIEPDNNRWIEAVDRVEKEQLLNGWYAEAAKYIQQKNWQQAEASLLQIINLRSTYRDAVQMLSSVIKEKAGEEPTEKPESKQDFFRRLPSKYLIAFFGIIVLVLCFFLFPFMFPPPPPVTISMVYSPEKEGWIKERIASFNARGMKANNQKIIVEGISQSSGDARTDIKNKAKNITIWSPSSSIWLQILKSETKDLNIGNLQGYLVQTPVVISMWQPMAEAMGWPEKNIGWNDLLALINDPEGWGKYGHREWGRFTWGHTDPEVSTTAISTLLAEFYAITNKQGDLTISDIENDKSRQFILGLGQGIKHYGYDTLIFSKSMQDFGQSYISAFPMEEVTLIDFNKANQKSTQNPPLVAIYPEEGTFWHDNPFIIMSNANAIEQEAAKAFFDYLQTAESQQLAISYGFRPAISTIPLADPISVEYGVDPDGGKNVLEVPQADVIVAAKDSWAKNRKRADIMLVIDVSGSMQNKPGQMKFDQVKSGLDSFLQHLLEDDRVGLITFSDTATQVVAPDYLSKNRTKLQDAIDAMRADGQTALFEGLDTARKSFDTLPATADERIRAIVLLSDGADNKKNGITIEQVENNFNERGINIFPVAYAYDDVGMQAKSARDILDRIAKISHTNIIEGGTEEIRIIFEKLSKYF